MARDLKSGGELLVDALRVHGCDHVFCVPGESYLAVLDALDQLQAEHPREDHRFTLHHFAQARPAELDRLAAAGALVSANVYYNYFMADIYAERGLGLPREPRAGAVR